MLTFNTQSTIRITTYNTHFGRKLSQLIQSFKENKNLKKSDVILLQEVEAFPKIGLIQAKKMADELGYHFTYAAAREIRRIGVGKKGTHGLAILSKYPVISSHIIHLPYFKLPLHSRKRIALLVRIKILNMEFYVCNIHLDARIDIVCRIKQLEGAIKYLQKLSGVPVILGGDFNTFPFWVIFKMLPLPYYNQYKKIHEFLLQNNFKYFTNFKGSTMRRGYLGMKLDHIYSTKLPIVSCGVEKKVIASDHKPVWADILIN